MASCCLAAVTHRSPSAWCCSQASGPASSYLRPTFLDTPRCRAASPSPPLRTSFHHCPDGVIKHCVCVVHCMSRVHARDNLTLVVDSSGPCTAVGTLVLTATGTLITLTNILQGSY
ncbi:hypothetical protein GY45DRAFT_580426 [Cubamyces sp. BRFM 1775]|nr:hypothetical protein GY45DRAFT_580426 [Cubamyces sp. BRFM 1775]